MSLLLDAVTLRQRASKNRLARSLLGGSQPALCRHTLGEVCSSSAGRVLDPTGPFVYVCTSDRMDRALIRLIYLSYCNTTTRLCTHKRKRSCGQRPPRKMRARRTRSCGRASRQPRGRLACRRCGASLPAAARASPRRTTSPGICGTANRQGTGARDRGARTKNSESGWIASLVARDRPWEQRARGRICPGLLRGLRVAARARV